MEYCLAAAIIDGDCGLDQFETARMDDAKLRDLASRVTTRIDETFEYRNGIYPATVTLIMRSGERISHHVVEATGQPDRPLSSANNCCENSPDALRGVCLKHNGVRPFRVCRRWKSATTFGSSPKHWE